MARLGFLARPTRMCVTVAAFTAALAASGCFFSNRTCDFANCGSGGSGGTSNTSTSSVSTSSSTTGMMTQCVPSLTDAPSADTCGIFVDPLNGNDLSPGTMELPKKTLGSAVGAWMVGGAVYVGDGALSDTMGITLPAGIVVYGGLDRSNGYRLKAETARSTLAPVAGEIPLKLADGSGMTDVQHLAINATAANAPGSSAVAVIVGNVGASLESIDVVAGDATPGSNSVTPTDNVGSSNPSDPTVRGNAGNQAAGVAQVLGGAAKTNPLCSSTGGKGGYGGGANGVISFPGGAGDNGVAVPAVIGAPPNDGLGGQADNGSGCTSGHNGGGGNPVTDGDGASGPTSLGTIAMDGYHGTGGAKGPDGNPGQAGGGGGGAHGTTGPDFAGASGGGGGAGGCGGKGALGGGPGGSSIGIIALGSTPPVLLNVTIKAGKGGNGGSGAAGEPGVTGGNGGMPGATINTPACAGGAGGGGSNGGASGGGHGGHSIGIAFATAAPTGGFTAQTQPASKGGATVGTGKAADGGVSAATQQL